MTMLTSICKYTNKISGFIHRRAIHSDVWKVCDGGGGACACFGHVLMFRCDAAHTGVVETTSIFHTCSSAVIDMFNIETTRGIQSWDTLSQKVCQRKLKLRVR